MACNSGMCQSGDCLRDEEKRENSTDDIGSNKEANGTAPRAKDHSIMCIKCKTSETISGAGEGGRFCLECFRSNLFGKFRFAVTSNNMISPTDNVIVAFSGGFSSRVALQFVHEMQHKAQKNFDASKDRLLSVFGVGVAFIDESVVHSVASNELEEAIRDMESIVLNLAPPMKKFHVVPVESIYSSECCDQRGRLKELLDAVSDATGKEDLISHLRMMCLQKLAAEHGYNKLVLGTCTSKIACHVISEIVKGQGFSLPADIQYVDSRWEIPVMLPLRDCLARELNILCHFDHLKTVEIINGPGAGINGLISSFVTQLQEENPFRECTIVRTAAKLTPFHFNRLPDNHESDVNMALQRHCKKNNLKPNKTLSSVSSFCPVCNCPLDNRSGLQSSSGSHMSADIFEATCCLSCQFQILPEEASLKEHFYSLLPQPLVARAKGHNFGNHVFLREQIEDCLISNSEDDT